MLGPGLHQQPFNSPLHRGGKCGSAAFSVEQDVVFFHLGIHVELQGQLHTDGIERLNVDTHGPGFIQEQAKPHGFLLKLGPGLGGNPCLVQDGGQATGQRHEIGLRESEEAGAGCVGMGREPARLFVLLQFLVQGGVGLKLLHRVHSL